MSGDTTETTAAALPTGVRGGDIAGVLRERLGGERMLSLGAAWRALWLSRLLVWTAGVGGLLVLGRAARWRSFDPAGLTAQFGALGNALVAPAARWDAVWYLGIANDGYGEHTRAAFFPLYPLLVRGAGFITGSPLIAGMLVSLAAFAVALYLLHRLASLELGREAATLAVTLVAVFPAAYCFSAVYSESLFLALSVGAIYSARLGRFGWACTAGALAAATRSAGLVVLVPIALLYLYGPRADRPASTRPSRWAPRHPLRADALWMLLIPLGLGAFVAYMGIAHGDPLAPFDVQGHWGRHVAGPFGGIVTGAEAAWDGLRQLLSGSRSHVYFARAAGDPMLVAAQNLCLFGFLALAVAGTVGVLRRLPPAYGGYMVVALALPLSYPVGAQPLMSLPRFMAVLFPLHMWLAVWARSQGRERWLRITSAVLLAVFAALFAAWQWVA
jgi:hypothetical protein